MSIPSVDEDKLKFVLKRNISPSDHIKSPERLYGREKLLTQIDRALNSSGRHVFIHGDRGVGKTSLAMTAAYLHQHPSNEPIYVLCSASSTFSELVYAIGNNSLPLKERMETKPDAASVGVNLFGFGGSFKGGKGPAASFSAPNDINDATNIIRYINERRPGTNVVVIDELERLKNEDDKQKLAEFINSLSSVQSNTKIILCGIGRTVEELLGAHQSAMRKLETIELEPISHTFLWKIISTTAEELGIEVSQEHLIRSSILSNGFPHYVHLIAESLIWAMFDDDALCTMATREHFKEAVRGALNRTQAEHKFAYQKATEKTKNTRDYEISLWSLADRTETRRQLSSIYDDSYLKLNKIYKFEPTLDKKKLNQRLLTLRGDGHGSVVVGHGSGWFSFRENIMRGYVRLVAESKGVLLAQDHAS